MDSCVIAVFLWYLSVCVRSCALHTTLRVFPVIPVVFTTVMVIIFLFPLRLKSLKLSVFSKTNKL